MPTTRDVDIPYGQMPLARRTSMSNYRCAFPSTGQVQSSVQFGHAPDDLLTGTLTISFVNVLDLRRGVDRGDGQLGVVDLPAAGNVAEGVGCGANGTEIIGTRVDAAEADVLLDTEYGDLAAPIRGTLRPFYVATPSTDSLVQRILDVLDARLKSILTANGYKTNAGQNVKLEYGQSISPTKMPAIAYFYRSSTPTQDTIGMDWHEMTVDVVLLAEADTAVSAAIALRTLRADLITALGADETFSGLVEIFSLGNDSQRVEQHDKKVFVMPVTLVMEYGSDRLNAYQ